LFLVHITNSQVLHCNHLYIVLQQQPCPYNMSTSVLVIIYFISAVVKYNIETTVNISVS